MTIVPFLYKINNLILNPIILLLFGIAFVYFIYGIITFISLEPGDSKKKDARSSIIWGIVGMLVMFSVYGLIGFVFDTFGITNPQAIDFLQGK